MAVGPSLIGMSTVENRGSGVISAERSKLNNSDNNNNVYGIVPCVDDIESQSISNNINNKTNNNYAFLSVSVRTPINLCSGIAIIYSLLPYLIAILLFIWYIATNHLYPLLSLVLITVVSVLSEFVLKNLFRQSRPVDSLVKSYGMPSSHTFACSALLIWTTFEILFNFYYINLFYRIITVIICFIFFAPLPWARWVVSDHSCQQVLVGTAMGLCVGVAVFYLRQNFIPGELMQTVTKT
eukprot:GHVR01010434.1.p1 GENE.GHVR01010434.1~~GHVR01010434.1.p1  ORF type:complete len:239 (-),score=48.81 GHVR01010434.1:191-907(-)